MKPITLTTERLILRKSVDDDNENLFHAGVVAQNRRNFRFGSITTQLVNNTLTIDFFECINHGAILYMITKSHT